jgi:hypothetical protein
VHAFVEHVPYFAKEIVPTFQDSPIAIVSPDAGGVARAKLFMESLSAMNVQVRMVYMLASIFYTEPPPTSFHRISPLMQLMYANCDIHHRHDHLQ